ncbi:unnamed protein product [Calicophoron daubneyi]|uniref:Ankyrin n=1 Tax=Calicophoron daubneyi TaxID=300641 RepID=A0AAV2TFX0_CALDB
MTRADGLNEEKPPPALSEAEQGFLRAARAGNLAKVTELLNGGININLSNPTGLTALHLAAKEGYVNVVSELLRRGADFDTPTKKGNTALHIASLAGHLEVVRLLLDAGADINRQSVVGFTPLYMAAQENHLDVVDLLLKRGGRQDLTTEDGFTPLAVALQQGHEHVVALLLERDSRSRGRMPALHIAARKDDVNAVGLLLNNPEVNVNHQAQHGFTPLHIAAHYGNVNVARPLIDRGADVNFQAKNNITPLHIAAKWGRLEMVQLLLSHGALVDCRTRDGLTPLHCAARSGYADLCSLLIDASANPSAKTRNGLTPLHMAAQGNHEEVAKILIMRGASVEDKTGDMLTPLHVAAHCGNREVAKILLDNQSEVNARALNGFTPLHIACKKQKLSVAELLLMYGAQVDVITESGLSPLHVAAFIGSPEIVQRLLDHGAVVDQATMRCETALHLAARNRQVDVARVLLQHRATVDAKAKDDQTPLHMAVLSGSIEMITLLLSAGADPNLPTRDAYTTMHIAAKEGHQDVIRLLLDAGASASARTKKGFTPLHLAAKRGRVKAARQLIQAQPKDVNAFGQNDLTPLHVATHYNHLRVVELLLDSGAEVGCRAGNGYTPLHIAAKHNHLDIATLLLAQESDGFRIADAESRSGFTPLHLAAQEGHTDMVSLLLQHSASPNHQAKNGLAPLHLAAQEDHVSVAQILLAAGAEVSPLTRAGYSPLHTACHFGQLNMVRFLLELPNAPDINQRTQMGFTPLHLATQQGHSQVVRLLLEMGADSNLRNQQGLTPAHIARKQHYVTIFDILKTVTTTVTSWEEEREELDETLVLEHPENMREHPFVESDDEAVPSPVPSHRVPHTRPKADDSLASAGSFGEQKSRTGTFSAGMDATFPSGGENDDIWGQLEYMRSTLTEENTSELTSPQVAAVVETTPLQHAVPRDDSRMYGESEQAGAEWELEAENANIVRKPVTAGFLVSFIVDARGGVIQAQRYSDLRFLIPPNAISGPIRIVCRMVHPERLYSPPPMNDGDGFACRLLELGPVGVRFTTPIVLEIPHFAFLTDKNREVVILRSDNGETWKEHPLDANDQAVQDTVDGYFDSVSSSDELRKRSVHRILTYDLPQYFSLITRVRQELILIGPEGGVLKSSVVPEVQVEFPPDALHKKIRVGLQVHSIDREIVSRLLGARVSVSPIVTIEPRRRKFHKPIVLTIPLPKSTTASGERAGAGGHSSVGSPSLRLLCSITGGTSPAIWEDITGSSPLSAGKDSVSFTTTVSARLWLVDCPNIAEVVELASRVYRESLAVPYIGRFVVYGRRHDPEEAQLRCLCLTDDPADKTLETQEGFQVLAVGPSVEVLDEHPHWIETAGNLVPVAKTEEQLQLSMRAFHENRLNMVVRVKDMAQPAVGKLAFMRYPRAVLQAMGTPQKRVTVLEAALPDMVSVTGNGPILKTTDIDETPDVRLPPRRPIPEDITAGKRGRTAAVAPMIDGQTRETIARSELPLRQIASYISSDWHPLAVHLGLTPEDLQAVNEPNRTDEDRAYAALLLWRERRGDDPTAGTVLAQSLRQLGYEDAVKACMLNVEPVTSKEERNAALRVLESTDVDASFGGKTVQPSETSGIGTSYEGGLSQAPSSIPSGQNIDEVEMIVPTFVQRRRPPAGVVIGGHVPLEAAVLNYLQPAEVVERVENVPERSEALDGSMMQTENKVPIEEDVIVPVDAREKDAAMKEEKEVIAARESVPAHTEADQTPVDGEELGEIEVEETIEVVAAARCGDDKRTWGPVPEDIKKMFDETAAESFEVETAVTTSVYQQCGVLEATWGKAQEPDPDYKPKDSKSGDN